MLLIDAVYIHESGGKALLEYLITELKKNQRSFFLLLDKRMEAKAEKIIANVPYSFIEPTEKNRRRFYLHLPKGIDVVLCFANVPPPVHIIEISVFVFMQNVLLLADFADRNLHSFVSKIQFYLKKCYIRFLNKANYQWLVQTPSMQFRLESAIGVLPTKIHVTPFFAESYSLPSAGKHDSFKFIYVADGVPHKNHNILLEAWLLLKEKYGDTPELHLTVPDTYPVILNKIALLSQKGLRIHNHGVCTYNELNRLYAECGYLIFPSLAESFGLPLLEASMAGCGVLASDLPFVYEIVIPTNVFDPYNKEMIVKSVRDAMQSIPKSNLVISNHYKQLIQLLK